MATGRPQTNTEAPLATRATGSPAPVRITVPVAALALGRDPVVAPALGKDPVVALALEIGPVVELVLEIAQVVAPALGKDPVEDPDRAPSRPRDRLVVARTASATTVSRAVLAVALVAAAEAQLDPPAAEADIAWAAAGSVAAALVAAEAEGVAEGAGDKRTIDEELQMKTKSNIMTSSKTCLIAFAIAISGFPGLALQAAPETKQDAAAASQVQQKTFDTPKAAADSLIQAAEAFDVPALTEILGPDSTDIISSVDPVADKNRAIAFAAKAKEKISLKTDPENKDLTIVTVGNDDFPLPIPIVKQKGKWLFDTKVGREEILNRRIGTNELDAIAICRGFVDAQLEYAQEKHDDSKVNQYAQRIISTPGKHDGLAWQNGDGTWGGPVGEGIAKALEQGYSKKDQPYHGYYFKVLKGQGPAALMGEMDFVVEGAMIGGFALAAAPAQHRVTGVKTFMIGPSGVVYEKDLGPDTLKTFEAMDKFNPDKTWKATDDQWPESDEEAAAE